MYYLLNSVNNLVAERAAPPGARACSELFVPRRATKVRRMFFAVRVTGSWKALLQ